MSELGQSFESLDRDFLYFKTYKAYADIAFNVLQTCEGAGLNAMKAYKNNAGALMWAMEISVANISEEGNIEALVQALNNECGHAASFFTAQDFYELEAQGVNLKSDPIFLEKWNDARPACPKCGTGESCDLPNPVRS